MRLIGIEIDADCPVCGAEITNLTLDLNVNCLSVCCLDEPIVCPKCGTELQMEYVVTISTVVMTWDDWERQEEEEKARDAN